MRSLPSPPFSILNAELPKFPYGPSDESRYHGFARGHDSVFSFFNGDAVKSPENDRVVSLSLAGEVLLSLIAPPVPGK